MGSVSLTSNLPVQFPTSGCEVVPGVCRAVNSPRREGVVATDRRTPGPGEGGYRGGYRGGRLVFVTGDWLTAGGRRDGDRG